MRYQVISLLGVLLLNYSGTGGASPDVIPLPVDMERLAVQIDVFCNKKALNVKPPIIERFRAWKERLGPYYSKYQQWNYEHSVVDVPPSERQRILGEHKARMIHLQEERLKELESRDGEAIEFCHRTAEWFSDPRFDAQVRHMFDGQDRPR